MPPSVLVKYDRCRLTLALPVYFDEQSLEKIRKVFKLIRDRPWQNEDAIETLDQFFPAWKTSLKNDLDRAASEELAAAQKVKGSQSNVACFGSMVTKAMKDDLRTKQKDLKHATSAVKRAKAAIERGGKIIDAYQSTKALKN